MAVGARRARLLVGGAMPRRVPVLLTGLALAACGTTVPGAGTTPVGSLGSAPSTATAVGGAAVAARPGLGARTTAAVPGGAAGGGSAPLGSGPVPTSAATGPAVLSSTPVQVGVNLPSSQATAIASSMGFSVDIGDPKAMAQAMAGWVNAHGGLAGHPVRLVFHTESLTTSWQQDQQVSCATFTQDNHAVAVVDPTAPTTQLGSCLAQRGVVLTGGGSSVFSEQQLSAMGLMWSPYLLAGERMARQLVTRLDAMGWFVKGDKIGLIYDETAPFPSLEGLVKEQLAARGLAVAAEASYSDASSQDMAAAMSGIALKFKASGVKRIIPVEYGSQVLLYFVPAARNQDYHPVYAITSSDVPNTIQSLDSSSDLAGSAGIGWSPALDVDASHAPAANAASRLCSQIYARAQVSSTSPLAAAFASGYCDGFLFLHQAYGAARSLDLSALRSAVAGLGGSYLSPVTFASWFGPGRYDGVQDTRDLTYDGRCSCYRYASPLVRVP